MLFVYIVSLLSSIFFGFSLRSFWAGVFSFMLVLCACDAAVYSAEKGQYVGPVRLFSIVDGVIDEVVADIAVAEQAAIEYNKCMDYFLNKAWGENQTIPSQKSLHFQCLKVAAERSLP